MQGKYLSPLFVVALLAACDGGPSIAATADAAVDAASPMDTAALPEATDVGVESAALSYDAGAPPT